MKIIVGFMYNKSHCTEESSCHSSLHLRGSILFFSLCFILIAVIPMPDIALVWFSVISGGLCIFSIKRIHNNYLTISVLFCGFSILYSISGPIAVLYGEGLHPIYYSVDHTNKFLSLTILAHSGILLSTIAFESKTLKIVTPKSTMALYITGIVLALMTSGFELINFHRAGGMGTLSSGKASYQSAIADMRFTLPTLLLALLSLIYFMLSGYYKKFKYWVIWIAILLPYISILAVIGSRGGIMAVALTGVVAYALQNPMSKLPLKLVLIATAIYVSMSLLNTVRSVLPHAIESGEYHLVTDRLSDAELIIKGLNPATAEFGTTFGNFSAYYDDPHSQRYFGSTYIEGLTMAIPRFLWPEKPQSILYEFRDEYFSSEASRGSIASTAYSSILEAYANFGPVGVLIIYIIFSMIFLNFERKLTRARGQFLIILYLLWTPLSMSFHRSALGDPIVINSLLVVFTLVIYRITEILIYTRPKDQLNVAA